MASLIPAPPSVSPRALSPTPCTSGTAKTGSSFRAATKIILQAGSSSVLALASRPRKVKVPSGRPPEATPRGGKANTALLCALRRHAAPRQPEFTRTYMGSLPLSHAASSSCCTLALPCPFPLSDVESRPHVTSTSRGWVMTRLGISTDQPTALPQSSSNEGGERREGGAGGQKTCNLLHLGVLGRRTCSIHTHPCRTGSDTPSTTEVCTSLQGRAHGLSDWDLLSG